MQVLKSFLDQSLLIWKDSTAAARFGMAVLLIICIGVFAGFGYWSIQPNYVVLASGLDPAKLGDVASALDGADISYTFKGSSTILVDNRELPRARIATSKLGIQGAGIELETPQIWGDPAAAQVIDRRNRELEIEHAIEQYVAIEKAEVSLSIPERQPFLRHASVPSAGVILTIASGAKFGESEAAGIARLVASSVPDLTVDQVTITDGDLNLYSTDESLGRLSSQEEHRVRRDRELSQKAESILWRFLGYGNASVTVTTDYSFDETTLDSTEYDSDSKGITSESIQNATTTGSNPTTGGAAGTALNVGNGGTIASGKQIVLSKTENIDSNYVPSVTRKQESMRTPILNSMGVSILVNKTVQEDTPETREQLLALVQQAVNFREAKDQIAIEFFEFVVPPEVEAPAFALPWEQINDILKNVSLGVAAVIALIVARKAFKKIQPDPSTTTSEVANRGTQVNQLSELVKQNPEVFSKIIASWSKLDADDKAADSQISKAA